MSGVAALDSVDDRDVPKMELLTAAYSGDSAKISQLLLNGVHIDATDDDGVTSLQIAASTGNNALVGYLLDQGADIEECNHLGMTPFHYAAREGKLGVIDTLLQRGAAFKKLTWMGASALTLAAAGGHAEVVKKLLSVGVDASPRGQPLTPTPLMAATAFRHSHVCGLLTYRGAPIDEVKETLMGLSALSTAICCAPVYMFSSLLDLGANPNKKSLWRRTAFELAKVLKRKEIINRLIEKRTWNNESSVDVRQLICDDKLESLGAVPHLDQPSPENITFLMFATIVRSISSIKRLLELQVDVNARDAAHINAIQIASMLRFDNVATLLLLRDCRTTDINKFALSAFDLFVSSADNLDTAIRPFLHPSRPKTLEQRLSLSQSSSSLYKTIQSKEWLTRVSSQRWFAASERAADSQRVETKQWLDIYANWHSAKDRNSLKLVLLNEILRGTKSVRPPEGNVYDAITDGMRVMIEEEQYFADTCFYDIYGEREEDKKGQEEHLVQYKHYDIAQHYAHISGYQYQSNRKWNPRNSLNLHRRDSNDSSGGERRRPRTVAFVETPSQNQMRTTPRMLKKSRESMVVIDESRNRRAVSTPQLVQIPTILPVSPLRHFTRVPTVSEDRIWQTMCKHGLFDYVKVFKDEEIDRETFFTLTEEDLGKMGIANPEHQAKILDIKKALANYNTA